MPKIVLFASGSGSNAENIAKYFTNTSIKIAGIYSNNAEAFVLERAKKYSIPTKTFTKQDLQNKNLLQELINVQPDLIVLAGFLWLIPNDIIAHFNKQIINIHPALLPKYGGKGMYGIHVHNAVFANNEKETGISIHYVNEKYDDGNIIFQAKCSIDNTDTPESIANKIHELEYEHYPKIIEQLLMNTR
jgi:phosphoribosylglycinamide formyltransferase-1